MTAALTIVLHGTFAADETWWRLGGGSFADRLAAALEHTPLAGSVWTPALRAGLTYEDFTWSGANRHADRVAAAEQITAGLRRVAQATGATAAAPLMVNVVAHSHGGNVALEIARRLAPDGAVRLRRVILLGTPLISSRPALRPARLALAAALPFALGRWLRPWPLGLLVYGWLFAIAAWLVDLVTRVVAWPWRQLAGDGAGQVYGPPPAALAQRVADRRLHLFMSHDDEADLVLHLSAAPEELYDEQVRAGLAWPARLVELVFARPLVRGLILHALEILLEHWGMGFEWWRTMFTDYAMADLDRGAAYPPSVVERVDVSDALAPDLAAAKAKLDAAPAVPLAIPAGAQGLDRHVATLKATIARVVANIAAQIKLRHSVYYSNATVLDEIVLRLVN